MYLLQSKTQLRILTDLEDGGSVRSGLFQSLLCFNHACVLYSQPVMSFLCFFNLVCTRVTNGKLGLEQILFYF